MAGTRSTTKSSGSATWFLLHCRRDADVLEKIGLQRVVPTQRIEAPLAARVSPARKFTDPSVTACPVMQGQASAADVDPNGLGCQIARGIADLWRQEICRSLVLYSGPGGPLF
jgi:hypothetical protein